MRRQVPTIELQGVLGVPILVFRHTAVLAEVVPVEVKHEGAHSRTVLADIPHMDLVLIGVLT